MYSIKEKLKILREMLSPEAAETDIDLLSRLAPGHEILSRARRCPVRYSEEVLYILLDKATKEDIRLHRRNSMCKDVNSEGEDAHSSGDVNPEGEDDTDVRRLKSELEEKDSELVEKEEELEEREAELDDRDEELSKKEAELKAVSEKKSSPKKKSTRKSTGRTSSIKTPKKQS